MLKRLPSKWKNTEIDLKRISRLKFEIQNYLLSLPSNAQWRRGRAARLGSAKAPTPVRIRTMPQNLQISLKVFLCSIFRKNELKLLFESERCFEISKLV